MMPAVQELATPEVRKMTSSALFGGCCCSLGSEFGRVVRSTVWQNDSRTI